MYKVLHFFQLFIHVTTITLKSKKKYGIKCYSLNGSVVYYLVITGDFDCYYKYYTNLVLCCSYSRMGQQVVRKEMLKPMDYSKLLHLQQQEQPRMSWSNLDSTKKKKIQVQQCIEQMIHCKGNDFK